MWIVILAPQVVVLTAFVRVCRSEPKSEFCSIPIYLKGALSSGRTMKEEGLSLQQMFVLSRTLHLPREQLLQLHLVIPHDLNMCVFCPFLLTFQDDSENLPPSYDMAWQFFRAQKNKIEKLTAFLSVTKQQISL